MISMSKLADTPVNESAGVERESKGGGGGGEVNGRNFRRSSASFSKFSLNEVNEGRVGEEAKSSWKNPKDSGAGDLDDGIESKLGSIISGDGNRDPENEAMNTPLRSPPAPKAPERKAGPGILGRIFKKPSGGRSADLADALEAEGRTQVFLRVFL